MPSADRFGGRQLGFVHAGARDRGAGQRDKELIPVVGEPDAARPLADSNPLDDGARCGIDDEHDAAGLVRHIQARACWWGGRRGRRAGGRRRGVLTAGGRA